MSRILTLVSDNKDSIIAITALFVSIVTAIAVWKQAKIDKTLSQLQIAREQPFFKVCTRLEQDTDDGTYGTEHLVVKNKGFQNITPKVSRTVLFEMSRNRNGDKDSILVKVADYFNYTETDNADDEIIYHSLGRGNNRVFHKLYMEALADKGEDGVYYWFDKIILVKIDYTDLLKEKHSVYFINKVVVDKDEYQKMLSRVNKEDYYLSSLDYQKIKALLPAD